MFNLWVRIQRDPYACLLIVDYTCIYLAVLCGLWDHSFLTRDSTWAFTVKCEVLTTASPGNSQITLAFNLEITGMVRREFLYILHQDSSVFHFYHICLFFFVFIHTCTQIYIFWTVFEESTDMMPIILKHFSMYFLKPRIFSHITTIFTSKSGN